MSKRTLRSRIALGLITLTGWKPSGPAPDTDRCVMIAAPHTSNWDFPYLLLFAACFDLKISWMGKHSLFRPPMGWFMKAVGGIPIVRHRRENVVESMSRAFDKRPDGSIRPLILVVPAEGTRAHSEYWKSGFYHIAIAAEVPIVMSFLDWGRKRGGFAPSFRPSGDLRKDMDHIRAFYADKSGKIPEHFSRIRLREEDVASGTADRDRTHAGGGSGEVHEDR